MGRDSSVGVVTRYRLDGLGIESRWDEVFRTCPDRPWGPPSLLYKGFRVFPRVKRLRYGVDHSSLSSIEFKGSRGIPVHPFWALVACCRVNFTFTFTYLLTPWSRVLLEKLASLQLVKKFPTFYGTRRFLTALTSARHLSLS